MNKSRVVSGRIALAWRKTSTPVISGIRWSERITWTRWADRRILERLGACSKVITR